MLECCLYIIGQWGRGTPTPMTIITPTLSIKNATINMIEGIAENAKDIGDVIYAPKAGYSAIVNNITSYGVLTVWNSSVLQYQHLSSFDNSVIDNFYIIKRPDYASFASAGASVGDSLNALVLVALIAKAVVLAIGGIIMHTKHKRAPNNCLIV